MVQTKVFFGNACSQVERRANKWLKKKRRHQLILHSLTTALSSVEFTLTLLYTIKKRKGKKK